MPVDTVKTTMQVTGKFSNVVNKVKVEGIPALYHGSLASASATFVGHYPWFFTYNFLSEKIPEQDEPLKELGRRAILGHTILGNSPLLFSVSMTYIDLPVY